MTCAACGHDNESQRRYCGACGARVRCECPRCTFDNRATDAFCGGCGDRLAAPATAPLPAPRPARPRTTDTHVVCERDLKELLAGAREPALGPARAAGAVSQDELDALFGEA